MKTKNDTLVIAAAAVLSVLALCFTAVLIWGPQDTQTRAVEAVAWLASSGVAVRVLRWLTKDSDGDGTPDRLDAAPNDPEES